MGGIVRRPLRTTCSTTAGEASTRTQILIYSLLLFAVTLLLIPFGAASYFYFASAVVLGAGFITLAVRLWLKGTSSAAANLFRYSLVYLALLFAAVAVAFAVTARRRPVAELAVDRDSPEPFLDALKTGARAMRGSSAIVVSVALVLVAYFTFGAAEVLLLVAATDQLDMGRGGYGALNAAYGIGAVAALTFVNRAAGTGRTTELLGLGVLLAGLPDALSLSWALALEHSPDGLRVVAGSADAPAPTPFTTVATVAPLPDPTTGCVRPRCRRPPRPERLPRGTRNPPRPPRGPRPPPGRRSAAAALQPRYRRDARVSADSAG